MFDDARPERISVHIWVATYDAKRFVCARCKSEILQRHVAFYTRTRPADAFDTWCPTCSHQLVRWAAKGAVVDDKILDADALDQVRAMVRDGS